MRNKTTNQNKGMSVKTCETTKATKRTAKPLIKGYAFRNTRPKTMVLTVERTANGYTLQEATILNKINQYTARPVSVDIRSITEDLNKKGFIA
jgi:hypothetical protein